jgi:predicted MFS family arabinose efflux permease
MVAAPCGTARAFAAPSFRALPPLIAPDGGLPRLIALYSGTWQFGLIVGPAASGFLYAAHPMVPYLVAAVFFTTASLIATTLTLRRPQTRTPGTERASLHHAFEGLRFIRVQPVLLGAIALDMFAVLFGGAVALLPAIAEDRLGVGDIAYGWLRAAPGIGAAAMALLLASRPIRRHVGRTLLVAVGIFGLGTLVLGTTTSFFVAFVALLVLSAADMISVFIRGSLVPLVTPDEKRGRVLAVENVFIGASNELGAFESGLVGQAIGVPATVIGGGVGTLVVVGVWSVAFPSLRDVDRFEDLEEEYHTMEPGAITPSA